MSLQVLHSNGQADGTIDDAIVDLSSTIVGSYSFTNNSAQDVLIALDLGIDVFAASSVDAIGSETARAQAFVNIFGSGDSDPLSSVALLSVASDIVASSQDSLSFTNPISFLLAAGGNYVLDMTVGFNGNAFSPATAVPLPPAALLLPFGLVGLMRASRRKTLIVA